MHMCVGVYVGVFVYVGVWVYVGVFVPVQTTLNPRETRILQIATPLL